MCTVGVRDHARGRAAGGEEAIEKIGLAEASYEDGRTKHGRLTGDAF